MLLGALCFAPSLAESLRLRGEVTCPLLNWDRNWADVPRVTGCPPSHIGFPGVPEPPYGGARGSANTLASPLQRGWGA